MPPNHRYRADWTPDRIRRPASRGGPNAEAFAVVVTRERRHPEHPSAACERALTINARSYTSLHSILAHGLDRATVDPAISLLNIHGGDDVR
ncbi:MAG: hypothetical protein AAGI50_00380 [Pseudomonadota bacterium]